MPTIKKLILGLILLIPAPGFCTDLHYTLDVDIDPARLIISGTAHISSQSDRDLTLGIENLRNLVVHSGKIITQSEKTMVLKMTKDIESRISFQVSLSDMTGSFMDAEHVFLSDHWYPLPSSLAEYQLILRIPHDFVAVSEADVIHRKQSGSIATYTFNFEHPVDAVHIAASSQYTVQRDYYQGIEIETYFFKEDAGLAETYIRHAIAYLRQYQELLTFYPYRRFAIVENILPTGISLPTFTLLGRDVIRLPFIVKTSLGHEILHQWFGNAVYMDTRYGNWAEGLTTYLADHGTAAGDGRDTAYRKQIMVDHEAYVRPETVIPLSAFKYRRNRSESVIGYGKAAMFFHELHNRLGKDRFHEILRNFVHQHLFRRASWMDIQTSFEETAGHPLDEIFDVWLNRTDIPVLDIDNARLLVSRGKLHLTFDLHRQSDQSPLTLPVSIYTDDVPSVSFIQVPASTKTIDLPLAALPSKVVLDEQYHVMRHLAEAETPPVLAAILGSPEIVVVISPEERHIFQPLIDALDIPDVTYMTPDNANITSLSEHNLLIAGSNSDLSKTLFGKIDMPAAGVRLRIFKSPFHLAQRILLADVANKAEAVAIRHKLRHYGSYSDLAFKRGRNTRKEIAETQNGISIFQGTSPLAVIPDQIQTLDKIIPHLLQKRVIFVGEQHNRFEHHINQLHIIQQFQKNGSDFGVGMEMFKKPFQDIIDAYLSDRIDEQAFLKQTRYFKEWGYDYHLYKPIIDFIKKHNIPLIALNLPDEITRQVSRSGIHMLDPVDKDLLPESLDFSDSRYASDLREIFALHSSQADLENFNYFYQAQTLWDETMAETAYQFLQKTPHQKLIVLAGNGHLRFRYGIPKRLHRRTQVSSAVILQDETIESGIADYVLQTTRIEGQRSPKLGVAVEENEMGLMLKSVVNKSPAQKSGLEKGDIISHFNHLSIKSLADLRWGLFTTEPGSTYPLQIKRNDCILHKKIQLFDFSPPPRHPSK
jgi:aminopeptidase N